LSRRLSPNLKSRRARQRSQRRSSSWGEQKEDASIAAGLDDAQPDEQPLLGAPARTARSPDGDGTRPRAYRQAATAGSGDPHSASASLTTGIVSLRWALI
ncbi:hypothetical protein LXA20_17455, partial [Erwinia amylovora]|uniref:hypothetical protein n=1 Tax=Erwinia amylovora TaxID=552 RepID=UPI0020C16E0B